MALQGHSIDWSSLDAFKARHYFDMMVCAFDVNRKELVHERQLLYEVRQVLHLERSLVEQLDEMAAVMDEAKLPRPAWLGLHDERHDQAWFVSFSVPCSYVVVPRGDRAHVSELANSLARPLHVLRLDAVAARVVRRWPDAVRQGHLEAVTPYAM